MEGQTSLNFIWNIFICVQNILGFGTTGEIDDNFGWNNPLRFYKIQYQNYIAFALIFYSFSDIWDIPINILWSAALKSVSEHNFSGVS